MSRETARPFWVMGWPNPEAPLSPRFVAFSAEPDAIHGYPQSGRFTRFWTSRGSSQLHSLTGAFGLQLIDLDVEALTRPVQARVRLYPSRRGWAHMSYPDASHLKLEIGGEAATFCRSGFRAFTGASRRQTSWNFGAHWWSVHRDLLRFV